MHVDVITEPSDAWFYFIHIIESISMEHHMDMHCLGFTPCVGIWMNQSHKIPVHPWLQLGAKAISEPGVSYINILYTISQSFAMWCLSIILLVSLSDKQRNITLHKLAKQRQVLSILAEHKLRMLGHITCMDHNHLPKKTLVCMCAESHRRAGGQRMRWNNLVTRHLIVSESEEDW